MKLSIIVPIYNAGSKIHLLLDSVLKSKLEFEVICVNDGSTDNTVEEINHISDTRVKLYTKQNGGTFRAWQYGLERAVGEYVTILDQDDYIDTEYIDYIFNFIDNIGAEILFSPYIIEKENGDGKICGIPFDEGLYTGDKLESIRKKLVGGSVPYAKFTKVLLKEILVKQVETTYKGQIHDFEDWLTMIEVFNNTKSIYFCKKAFYHYIQYENSVSRSSKSYKKNYDSLQAAIEFLKRSEYAHLQEEDIQSISFYGERCILNKCTKIHEILLASQIIKSREFQSYLSKSNLSPIEKLILKQKNAHLYYLCYRLKSII
ncbi:glycosyltransferase family 2 protein [Sporofaciens sp. SGI.106]|uniref:glycosyltransferase family 2 protein n=1 Tax=Sporofaciens sp. SGI.106 TaxID=3420568 RepID=UPI003D046BC0